VCPKCGRRYSEEEHGRSIFCECGKALVRESPASLPRVHSIAEDTATRDSFIRQVYSNVAVLKKSPSTGCDRCYERYQFSRLGRFPYKTCLPPIGSSDRGQVLFVGTNPRCRLGTGDEDFYRHALSSEERFLQFSNDGVYRDRHGHEEWLFSDRHYGTHRACLKEISASRRLGEGSSVAELFMCGSEDANIFYKIDNLYQKYGLDNYVCAQEYLVKYMEIVKPRIIVSFGWVALQWFQSRYGTDLRRRARYVEDSAPKNFAGNPTRNNITRLHSCFSEITLDSGHTSSTIFSIHPARAQEEDKAKLLRAFRFVHSHS
jgi:uracil-DNA glycosylase